MRDLCSAARRSVLGQKVEVSLRNRLIRDAEEMAFATYIDSAINAGIEADFRQQGGGRSGPAWLSTSLFALIQIEPR